MQIKWKTVGIVAGCTVVGGAVACVASPAVGYWVGNALFGWTGCAATSSGLAALGGGSLASGGLGMAGGTAAVTGAGAGVGSKVGIVADKAMEHLQKRRSQNPVTMPLTITIKPDEPEA